MAQAVPTQARVGAAQAVVKITSLGCRHNNGSVPDRTGTGFLFGSTGTLVTALHVVANCSNVTAWFEQEPNKPTRALSLERTLAKRDLALMRIAGTSAQTPLQVGQVPSPGKPLAAVGYALDQASMQDWDSALALGTLKPPDGTSTIVEMLDPATAQSMSTSTVSIYERVLRFSSHFQPGMSGGPVIDQSGQVIGVVGGGMRQGLAPVSWAWPTTLLPALLASTEPVTVQFSYQQAFYALQAPATGPRQSITCGELSFGRVRRASFTDVAASADDQPRIAHIVNVSTLPRAQIDAFTFDIWRDPASGATFATPENVTLQQQNGYCEFTSADQIFRQFVQGRRVATPWDVNTVSTQFEQQFAGRYFVPQFGSFGDQHLTTTGPMMRNETSNGVMLVPFNPMAPQDPAQRGVAFVVYRKGVMMPRGYMLPGAPPPHTVHAFETIVAKGEAFLGVQAINERYMPPPCSPQPGQPGCVVDRGYMATFAQFVLATQLATFPVN
ncbi:S1 family peptidase [Bosea sp. LjRoot237]|uniref:S1 family peptidase n=1 Tax=Bosea sp. LjRoot237 TaxID=3342292 RepID=UPI003ED0679D